MRWSGPQLAALDAALRSAYRARHELSRLIHYKFDRNLDDLVGNCGMEETVHRLLERAAADGWCLDLYEKACADRPDNHELRSVRPVLGLASSPVQQLDSELLDITNFDLVDTERSFWRARSEVGQGGILGLLIRTMEEVTLGKLVKRIERALDPCEPKAALTLSPEMNSLDRPLRILGRYRGDLQDRNVVCVVRAEGAHAGDFDRFWAGLPAALGELPNLLVLIFTGAATTATPAGVAELPSPEFERAEILQWTSEVSRRLRWSGADAYAWAGLLEAQSRDENQRLDPYFLYDSLEKSAKAIMADPDGYSRMLRGVG